MGGEVESRYVIISFGAVLFEMLTGKRAFLRPTPHESLTAILKEDPLELLNSDVTIPSGLERILRRCLEKEPGRRFQSAHDLAFALEAIGTISGASAIPAIPIPRTSGPLPWLAGVAILSMAFFALGWFLSDRQIRQPTLSFQQLTFQPGVLSAARFSPDGQTIVYSGRFGTNAERVFTTRPGSAEFRSLDVPDGTTLLAVSSAGDLALRIVPPPGKAGPAVLARVPLAGGVPRPVAENVTYADWSPDGKDLAIVRTVPGGDQVEFPIGTKLAGAALPNSITNLRVSPKGDLIAFVEHPPGPNSPGHLCVVDRYGVKKTLSSEWLGVVFLAWSSEGDEIYFHGTRGVGEGAPSIRTVNLQGRERLVLKAFTELIIRDAREGKLLLTQTVGPRMEIATQAAGGTKERDLAWLTHSTPADLSADGSRLLFDETRLAGSQGSVFLRNTDGFPPVRLGEGMALALSPDGAWAATVETKSTASPVVLIPTGPGETKKLKDAKLIYLNARFVPDGTQLVSRASEPGHAPRLFVQTIEGGAPKAISPEGVNGLAISPDGTRAATVGPNGHVTGYPVIGGDGTELSGCVPGDIPLQWNADGKALLVDHPINRSHDIYRVDIVTGRRELVRSLTPDPTSAFVKILFTPDGRSHAFALYHFSTELYLVDGVK